mgnify:CR=1 FL=1
MQGQFVNLMRGAATICRIGKDVVNGQQAAFHHPRAPILPISQSGGHGMAAINKHEIRCRHGQARHHLRRAERGYHRVFETGAADIGAKLRQGGHAAFAIV